MFANKKNGFVTFFILVLIVTFQWSVVKAEEPETQKIILTETAERTGQYLYMPFEVPEGVNKVEAKIVEKGNTKVGLGVFDYRGAQYQSEGFRGVYGEERSQFFVTKSKASDAFQPGPTKAGTWTIFVPVFFVENPTEIKVEVTLTFGEQTGTVPSTLSLPTMDQDRGWYRGDLHAHTIHSSDAWNSKSGLTPSEWALTAERTGLDFVSLTDHNVTKQNYDLSAGKKHNVLLIGGEEMTNWFHGHATVTGLSPGEWLDFRQRPKGVPLGPYEKRIDQFIQQAENYDTYVSAAHPMAAHLSWQFFLDGEKNPAARPHGMEVWTGPWQLDDEASLKKWDELLNKGWKIWANGGSDTHGVENHNGFEPGKPTTVVYADELVEDGIVSGLRNGHSFITRSPNGPELYLTAQDKDEKAMVGDTMEGSAEERVNFSVHVKKGKGSRLVVIRDGATINTIPVQSNDETIDFDSIIQNEGYVRVELRKDSEINTESITASEMDMQAFTNPIFLEHK